jgi:hypothetical protein
MPRKETSGAVIRKTRWEKFYDGSFKVLIQLFFIVSSVLLSVFVVPILADWFQINMAVTFDGENYWDLEEPILYVLTYFLFWIFFQIIFYRMRKRRHKRRMAKV